jgi:Ca-activated chloride channel family protein
MLQTHPAFAPAALALSMLTLLAAPDSPGRLPPAASAGLQAGAAGVRTTELVVVARVVDGVASTTLRLALHNDGARPAEGVFVLPLPEGAVADDFRMTVGGVETSGDVLDAAQARGVYESIVRRRRDPGLLEHYGRGCLRASVFPIPANGDMVVEATYREMLPLAGHLFRWSFPVASAGVDGRAPERVVLDVAIRSTRPLAAVFAPDPAIDVARAGEHDAAASFELDRGALPDKLELFYGVADGDVGLHLASTRPGAAGGGASTGEPGVFTLLVAPRLAPDRDPIPRSIVFAVDTSSSMYGPKLAQAKAALRGFVDSLRPGDRFELVPFATGAEPAFGRALPFDAASRARALEAIERMRPKGGTNLEEAVVAALDALAGSDGLLSIVVLLTDGLPTVGERDVDALLALARERNARNGACARVFAFGVGDDVNTRLLDLLAQETGGTREYVRPGEAIDGKTAALFARIESPALTDVTLEAEGIELLDVVPRRMPDLYRGVPVTVVGRYRGEGPRRLVLRGTGRDGALEIERHARFAQDATPGLEFLPSLWAERQVGVLLDAIRLNGPDPELLDEVKRIGTEFHIVTPYTSHLIVEEGLRVPGGSSRTGVDSWFLGQGRRERGPGESAGRSGGGGGGPSTPGPSGPGTPGPSTPVPAGGSAAGGSPPLTGGGEGTPSLQELARELQRLGVLPAGLEEDALGELALRVARELRDSAAGLRELGRETTGERAVDDSAYLARLMSGAQRDESKLLDLFSRRVHGKVFYLRAGTWTDRAIDALPEETPRRTVEAWSDAYFALLRERPELGAYLALSDRMVVAVGAEILEVRPAAQQVVPRDPDVRDHPQDE